MGVRKTIRVGLVLTLLVGSFMVRPAAAGPFVDVSDDPRFSPHINRLYEYHLIDGRSSGANGSMDFEPNAWLTRAELAKLTTVSRLMEIYRVTAPTASEVADKNIHFTHRPLGEYRRTYRPRDATGLSDEFAKEAGKNEGKQLDFRFAINDLLAPFFSCSNAYAQAILGVKNVCNKLNTNGGEFTDVPGKEFDCDAPTADDEQSMESRCTPWYSQFVYYAAYRGFIHGYDDGSFRPDEPIKRWHALKMLLVDDGEIPPQNDARFQRLSALADARGSHYPKCLVAAESDLLKQAGADTDPEGAKRLLDYAVLADRLDFFANDCSLFPQGGSPAARADFLMGNLTRKEAARFFAISMDYPEVNPVPKEDPTINDATSNGFAGVDQPYFFEPRLASWVDLAAEPDPWNEVENQMDPQNIEAFLNDWAKEANPKQAPAEDQPSNQKEPVYQQHSRAGWSMADLIVQNKAGRCCEAKSLAQCSVIAFKEYSISKDSELGAFATMGHSWNAATNGKKQCWVPLDDLLDGYDAQTDAAPEQCEITSVQQALIQQYQSMNYANAVREIWQSGHPPALKMLMQIGLDQAIQTARQFEPLLQDRPLSACKKALKNIPALVSGHAAAVMRFWSLNHFKINQYF
ncbi:S-layer homology domain-containing protein [Candidatus Peregrinibacteria bacterium]|nr:MAG: S-layer homology domain-containing protein [Candidatus Peregrinibacteria bacterium]